MSRSGGFTLNQPVLVSHVEARLAHKIAKQLGFPLQDFLFVG